MDKKSNIIIADESALHLYLHTSDLDVFGAMPTWDNPLEESFSVPDTTSFNADHPLYGGLPIVLLVGGKDARRRSKRVVPRVCSPDVPMGSFVKMRNGLYVASPELTFVRMGNRVSEFQLAEIGMNLCGGYFVNQDTGDIDDRSRFLTSPGDLAAYARRASHLRGSKKAAAALRWIIPNSGSPAETKMKLQYCSPLWAGGFGLPFTHMNYDVLPGGLSKYMVQDDYCIDLVNPDLKVGMEYDGGDSHTDASKDKRRINELRVLDYELFPIDKAILYDPDATYRSGMQIRKYMGLRARFPEKWKQRYIALRRDLDLPV